MRGEEWIQIIDCKRKGESGSREEGGSGGGRLKSRIENAEEEGMGRGVWRVEGRLNSQIENAGEELMGREGWRGEKD